MPGSITYHDVSGSPGGQSRSRYESTSDRKEDRSIPKATPSACLKYTRPDETTHRTLWLWDPKRMAHPARQSGATPSTISPRLLTFIER